MKILTLPLLLLLAACSGNPTPTNFYLLRSGANIESRELEPSTRYGIGRLEIASYIDQGSLVLETADGEIHPARDHRWAESLSDSLRYFMVIEISQAAGQDILFDEAVERDWRIDIGINQLHGNARGEAVLVGFWRLRSDDETRSFQFSETAALTTDGYAALADAEKRLLARMAQAIAASLDTSPTP
jgi:uncharacterized lipoprotein YmbA